jgi:hypothetical protein
MLRDGKNSGRDEVRTGPVRACLCTRTDPRPPSLCKIARAHVVACPLVGCCFLLTRWVLRRLALPRWVGQPMSVRLLMSEPPSSCWLYFLLAIFLTRPSLFVRSFVDCHVSRVMSHCRQTPAPIALHDVDTVTVRGRGARSFAVG